MTTLVVGRQTLAMALRRSVALALVAVALTACGSQKGGTADGAGAARSATPTSSYPPPPKCAQSSATPTALPPSPSPSGTAGGQQDGPGDAPPNYADNHAYRMQASLSAEQQASGKASAELILAELAKVRKEGGSGEFGVFGDERVEAALRRVGCGEKHGVFVGNGYYAVYTGVVCVSGRVTKDELTGEVHGVYVEPQPGEGPCVENRGGH
ncbi:hypothetical protein ABZ835_07545 [Streptomyces sp. NPDC047461]|uniref:hypothetical protein n=1 Tax=Streptomyces sp. NPDC047461 TaxID=3155619 RepID=UPI0033FCE411